MNSNDKITAYSNIQDYDVKKQWDNKEKWIELTGGLQSFVWHVEAGIDYTQNMLVFVDGEGS